MAGDAGDGVAEDLVVLARNGDETGWSELYRLHHRRLVVWLRSVPSGDPAAAAEDVAAEAWSVAAHKIREFSGSADDFGGWLLGIARNIATNHRRRSARRQTFAAEQAGVGEPDARPDPEGAAVGEEYTRWLLGHLSPREAEVVACIDVVGLDVASAAQALGMSTTAVRVARHRALGRLRRVLPDQGDRR